jgi:hypothetical protein
MKDLIDDDFFKYMLNADLCIQIGKHIFRVNPVTEKVYDLPVANADQYNDLVNENTSNANIKVFSTGDDVLELIENGETSRKLFCKESGIDSKHAFVGDVHVGNYSISLNLYFNRFGIHFKLFAEGTTNGPDFVNMWVDMDPVFYHVRCDETVDYKSYDYPVANKQYFMSYQGAKNLNELWFKGRIKAVLKTNPAVSAVSDWTEIRQNK